MKYRRCPRFSATTSGRDAIEQSIQHEPSRSISNRMHVSHMSALFLVTDPDHDGAHIQAQSNNVLWT